MSAPLWALSVADAAQRIRRGEISPVELVDAVFARARAVEPIVHAYVALDEERCRAAAAELADEAARGRLRGPLHGVPLAVKDVFDVAGLSTRRGSAVYAGAPSASADAAVVERLRGAGALIVGKTVTHELACGVFSPPTRNPWDPTRSAGGSSGGSAAAVACGSALGALGTDTGGSVRIPAALCGVVGLKPTYGTVPLAGCAPLSRSLDHAGVIARSIDDADLLLQVMGWHAAEVGRGGMARTDSQRRSTPVRALVPTELVADLAPEVASAFAQMCAALSGRGVVLCDVSLPWLTHAASACEVTVFTAEAAEHYAGLVPARQDEIGSDVRAVLAAGAAVTPEALRAAHAERKRLAAAFDTALDECDCDFLACPTVPLTAYPPFEETSGAARDDIVVRATRNVIAWNVIGVPAVTLPIPPTDSALPVGLQLAARRFGEQELLDAARVVERIAGGPCASPLASGWPPFAPHGPGAVPGAESSRTQSPPRPQPRQGD